MALGTALKECKNFKVKHLVFFYFAVLLFFSIVHKIPMKPKVQLLFP